MSNATYFCSPDWESLLQQARRSLVDTLLVDFRQMAQWGAEVTASNYLLSDGDYLPYLARELAEAERDATYAAVVSNQLDWTAVRPRFEQLRDLPTNTTHFRVRVDAWGAEQRIYIPVFERRNLPADTWYCTWCGGYTHNDKRGHCAACGGPRDDRFLEEAGR